MEGLLWFLILGGLFYLMMRYGCGAHMVHGHSGHADHGGGEGESVDPVCGMTVSAGQGYTMTHQGNLYHFCSRSCLDKFEADPAKYLKPSGDNVGGGAS